MSAAAAFTTYAQPHLAVQTRIELVRVHLALADVAGARTLMQEIDELLKRRPGLGTLVGETRALSARLAKDRDSISGIVGTDHGRTAPAADALHPPVVPEIAAEMFLSPHTIKSEMKAIYRKRRLPRSQAVTCARELGLLEG